MILCCACTSRLLKQNEQLKKKDMKSKWMKIKERALKKSFCFCDASGLKNVFSCLLQARENPHSFCPLSLLPQSSISCSCWVTWNIHKVASRGQERRERAQQKTGDPANMEPQALKKISISFYLHRLFLYFSNAVDMVEKTLKNWPLRSYGILFWE